MQAFVDKINPKGKTPISRSLKAALDDFGDRTGEIILISDGIETCDEDPCELVRSWMEQDIQIKVHVVGLGLQEQERVAMQCISEAAGTEYQDAQSASELSAGLAKIQEFSGTIALKIRARTADGEPMTVHGTATPGEGEPIAVGSNRRNVIPAGKYTLELGVQTRNGNLYLPVTRTATVAPHGETTIEVVVEEPPSVSAKYVEEGEDVTAGVITALQDGTEVFKFRAIDTVYLDPGSYDFRAKPNAENELRIAESFARGEHKELVYEMVHTVHAVIRMVASASGLDYRQNYELWQDGERAYKVHWSNGIKALPGTYDLVLPNKLTPYTHTALVLTEEERQDFRIEVPSGHVTFVYQKADGTRDKDERVWLERMEGDKWVADRIRRTGRRMPLIPGTYRLKGWDRMGEYDLILFDIAVGDDKEIVLRSKS